MSAQNEEGPFPVLFSPIKVGHITLKNRTVCAPTGRGNADHDGTPNDQNLCAYVALAKGGVGMVIVQMTVVTPKFNSALRRELTLYDDFQLVKWRQLSDAIHAQGVPALVQLSLSLGKWAPGGHGIEVVDPSGIRGVYGDCPKGMRSMEGTLSKETRALTTKEVEELEEDFVAAAVRAKRAGFEGIEIHGCHGYLVAEFMSPGCNKRDDKYGGSFEKRLTLPLNLIRRTRTAVGNNDFVVGLRLSGDEHTDDGYSLEDCKRIVPVLVDAGLDYIHLSSGCPSAWKWTFPEKEGVMIAESAEIKKICKVPVFCPNIHRPRIAERLVAQGKADVISLTRALIADPQWPNKAKEGRVSEIVKCRFCNTCLHYMLNDLEVRCPRNPLVGWERFIPEYWPQGITIQEYKESKQDRRVPALSESGI